MRWERRRTLTCRCGHTDDEHLGHTDAERRRHTDRVTHASEWPCQHPGCSCADFEYEYYRVLRYSIPCSTCGHAWEWHADYAPEDGRYSCDVHGCDWKGCACSQFEAS